MKAKDEKRPTRGTVTADYFINWWLGKYHNITLDGVKLLHPEWVEDPMKHSRDFYDTYRVTEDQHDEWYEWAISEVMRIWRVGRKMAERDFAFAYLNTAPSVTKKK